MDRGEATGRGHARGKSVCRREAHRKRSAHRPGGVRRRPLRDDRERAAVSHRHDRHQGIEALHAGARAQLRERSPRRSVQRAGVRRLRAPPARLRLFRERAGVDRHRTSRRPTTRPSRCRSSRRRPSASRSAPATRPTRSIASAPTTATSTSTTTALQMYASARIESKIQQVDVRFVRPPTADGWIDTYGTGVQRTDIENLVTRTAAVTARRRAIDERRTPAFGIGFFVDDQDAAGRAEGIVARALRRRRVHVAQRRQPARAHAGMDGQRAGRRRHSRRVHEQFGRAIGRVVGWWPFTRTDQLVARFDAGAVIAQSRVGHPVELPVSHRRRHDGARLRVREPRRAAGRRGRRRPLLRRRERRGRALDQRRRGASPRSSTPATRATRCPSSIPRSATASARACGRRSARSASTSRTASRTSSVRVHFSVGLSF